MKPRLGTSTLVLALALPPLLTEAGLGNLPFAESTCFAQTPDDITGDARQLFEQGVKAYDGFRFEDARNAFLQAYSLKRHPAILLNLGLAELRVNRVEEGGNHLQQFLREHTSPTPDQKAAAEKGIAEAKKKTGLVIVVVDAQSAEVTIDGISVGKSPLRDPVFVKPGKHTIVATYQDKSATTQVEAKAGSAEAANLTLGVAGAPPGATGDPKPEGPATPEPPKPDESQLGGPGESCRARTDCRTGLKCVSAICRDEREGTTCGSTAECGGDLKCVNQVCTSQIPGAPGEVPEIPGQRWTDFKLGGMHPFAGITVAGGPVLPYILTFGRAGDVSGSFLFALRAGVLVDTTELGIEISPVTYLTTTATGSDPSFQFNGFVGRYYKLADRVYWPLRVGVGMVAANLPGKRVWFQGRADLIGLAYNAGHTLLELHVPTFRFGTDFQDIGLFTWDFGASASYVF